MADDDVGIVTIVLIVVIWALALIEPTPIGEGVAITFTLGALGLGEGGDS